jgi:hypothetical protein
VANAFLLYSLYEVKRKKRQEGCLPLVGALEVRGKKHENERNIIQNEKDPNISIWMQCKRFVCLKELRY